MRTPSHTLPPIVTEAATFIGIDYHKNGVSKKRENGVSVQKIDRFNGSGLLS